MKTATIPVRLDAAVRIRVERIAKRVGSSRGAIMRLAIYNQLAEIEAGTIKLRPELTQQETAEVGR